MITDYKGMKAVVTGAANGIGRAFALGFAKRGADVIVADIHGDEAELVAEEIRAMGRESKAVEADVTIKSDCRKIFDTTMEAFGRCDILVNNAGVSTPGEVWNIPEQDIRWVYETNVFSHWYMMGYFIPQMEAQKSHCQIVNVCSIAGLITSPASPSYFSSKHAAVALSEVIYKEMKERGSDIDVAVFCPGFVQTEMWKTDRHRPARFAMTDDEYYRSEWWEHMAAVSRYVTENGAPLDETMEKVFDMLGKETFYILTHDRYDALLRAQGEWVANKTRPVELADVGTTAQLKKDV